MDVDAFRTAGRVLFLSTDAAKVTAQLHGQDLSLEAALPLRQEVSEEEIAPGWVCYFFHQRLGDFPYMGLNCGGSYPVSEGWVRKGGFSVVVSGAGHGFHGVRMAVPYAEWSAGVRLVIADSFDPVYQRNCHTVGLLTSTDKGLVERIRAGEAIPMDTFTAGLPALSAEILRRGGTFGYTLARRAGTASLPLPAHAERPMTLVEKILARHALRDLTGGEPGLAAVAPGDALLVKADWRISHESATSLASAMLHDCLGDQLPLADPTHILAFHDHLSILGQNQVQEERQPGLQEGAKRMKKHQIEFCLSRGIRLHGETEEGGAEGISHVIMAERYVLPGQVVVGTDSHTCHNGALGALAFGVGTPDIANAWVTGDVCVTVPPTTLVRLDGLPRPGVSAKDLVLHLMALEEFRGRDLAGHVLEFQGPALAALSTDERSTLTNMAVDFGALAGIVPPDAETVRFIGDRRGCELHLEAWMRSDPGALFAGEVLVDCARIGPMVAAPGSPGNGVAVADLERAVAVDIAYVGSCTGGKRDDIERVHEVVRWALDNGLMLPLHVQFFIQLGSEDVRRHAERMGWISAFEEAGARVLNPGCGACINAGPGVSTRPEQVTIGAFNRNFPGRSGPGEVWLASPATVAASALSGRICDFETLKNRAREANPGI